MAEIRGVSIVAGEAAPATGEPFFGYDPVKGKALAQAYHAARDAEVEAACEAAWDAFVAMRRIDRSVRAAALDGIAERLASLGKPLVKVMSAETGLTTSRVLAERERAVGVLRMFAEIVREGSWVRACLEPGDKARRPNPKPELRRMLIPLGPVAVFGASNFPIAYSTAGGDTASALAAGCPVIVKGHPLHPGTGELVAWAVAEGVAQAGLPLGAFSFLHAGGARERTVGTKLVQDPRVRAVGFTGSFGGGTAIERLARERTMPIPVFSEMGSVNPVFVLPHVLEKKGAEIAERLASSVSNACGQMCTCPGIVFVVRSGPADEFERALAGQFDAAEPGYMLALRLQSGFVKGLDHMRAIEGVEVRAGALVTAQESGPATVSPVLLRTTGRRFLDEDDLREEVFGPSALLVVCSDEAEMMACALAMTGSLTGTIFAGSFDRALVAELEPVVCQRVGRVVFNGVPTGVEVNGAMVHGGPYPATTAPNSTAQGVLAMERWCRPVCYQNAPDDVLPEALQNANPQGIRREVAGEWTTAGLDELSAKS